MQARNHTLTLNDEQLTNCLSKFNGKLVDEEKITNYQRFSLNFFSDASSVLDPRVQVTSQLDITAIYQTYNKHYKHAEGATFTAYVKWISLKAMKDTPFGWRCINNKWYEFSNLPLEVSVYKQNGNQQLFYLYDVTDSSWPDFCKKHTAIKDQLKDSLEDIKSLPLYAIAHEIVGLNFPRMTAYNTTKKAEYAHQPWIVFSTRYEQDGKLLLPYHLSFSHAPLIPRLAEYFIDKFSALAKNHFLADFLDKKQEEKMVCKL